jgi:hypothetical protein
MDGTFITFTFSSDAKSLAGEVTRVTLLSRPTMACILSFAQIAGQYPELPESYETTSTFDFIGTLTSTNLNFFKVEN